MLTADIRATKHGYIRIFFLIFNCKLKNKQCFNKNQSNKSGNTFDTSLFLWTQTERSMLVIARTTPF